MCVNFFTTTVTVTRKQRKVLSGIFSIRSDAAFETTTLGSDNIASNSEIVRYTNSYIKLANKRTRDDFITFRMTSIFRLVFRIKIIPFGNSVMDF